ncbi:hypothetical protein [Desulfosporosinus sp. OT]|uniref:hypothetical protein n=1 Tax=Desulfosporosinus sp. OT TaxID=913865 RepID=UPI00058B7D43|nr:hypothetical protein [Desulfosporosinus sp. OT]
MSTAKGMELIMKKIFIVIISIMMLFTTVPAFAQTQTDENTGIVQNDHQKNIMRAYGLTEDEINNLTLEKLRDVMNNGKIKYPSYLVKETPSHKNNLTKDLERKIKAKGLTDQQIDALGDMGFMPEEIVSLDTENIKDKLKDTEIPFTTSVLPSVTTSATPPSGYHCVNQVPDNGGTDEWFHPNVDVSTAAVDFYVEASKYAAKYIFNDTSLSNLRYSYYLWGEWGEDANTTWCHEGVDLQYVPNNNRAVRLNMKGNVTYSDGYYLNVYDPILKVTYNYQHLTNMPTFTVGQYLTVGTIIGYQNPGDAHVHTQVESGNCGTTIYSGRDLNLQCIEPYAKMIYWI